MLDFGFLQCRPGLASSGSDNAIHAVAQEQVQEMPHAQHLVGITNSQAVLGGLEHILDPAEHLTKEKVGGVGDNHAHRACTSRCEAAAGDVGDDSRVC